jgi:hypothetical protein
MPAFRTSSEHEHCAGLNADEAVHWTARGLVKLRVRMQE